MSAPVTAVVRPVFARTIPEIASLRTKMLIIVPAQRKALLCCLFFYIFTWMKLRALIVDDEKHARENLRYLLENYCPQIEVIGLTHDLKSARLQTLNLAPQVIFLDICMPSGTEGFDFLDMLPEKNFQVVFVTAFKDYAIRALNANAISYLQKPVDVDDLQEAVNKLLHNHRLFSESHEQLQNYTRSLDNLSNTLQQELPARHITIHNAGGFRIIEQKELMYLEGEGNQTAMVFADGSRCTDSKSISVYEHILAPGDFFRIHKSLIVNLNCVREFLDEKGHFVVMANNTRLPVSRIRLFGLKEHFKAGSTASEQ